MHDITCVHIQAPKWVEISKPVSELYLREALDILPTLESFGCICQLECVMYSIVSKRILIHK